MQKRTYLTNVTTNDSFGNFDWQKHIEQSQ